MTPKQLREWLFQNGQEDQWWLSLDAVTEESPLTVSEIEERVRLREYGTAQALHVSQAEMSNPPWIDVEFPSQTASAPPNMPQTIYQQLPANKPLGQQAGMRILLPVGRSGWAIAAGYLGLFGLLVLPAPLALITAIIALIDIQKSKNTTAPKHGMGRAIFGLIVGIIGTLLLLLALINILD